MELLYNPDQMPEEEIKATFVAREQLVDELVALIASQPDGAGVQHAVIIAPRGMGKTTVLLMIKFAIEDRGLDDRWQAVKFPEESYSIYDLADFWVEVLHLIAADTKDQGLRRLADDLKSQYPNNDQLQEAAYAVLKDWRRQHGKRLLLLVENFDQILEQINDERDNARLRDVLMNDGTIMILGGATTFFKEARAYDQPLYNFFKIYDLADLKFEQMQELLRRRAALDRVADFEAKLKRNASRLRALEYFTGGNPRLVLMLYRVVSHSDVTEVRRALEKLLDEVTPYYKAKVETLPSQQRKILDHIARISGETNEGLTPGEIAAAVRLSPNQVSAQLKRLSELGYVRAANLRGRSSYYTLSEPLYAIWHQMRFGRDARERMRWLINFIKVWYAAEEMSAEFQRLRAYFWELAVANRSREACDVLAYLNYLAAAISDAPVRTAMLEELIRDGLNLKDAAPFVRELLQGEKLEVFSGRTLESLYEAGYISGQELNDAKATEGPRRAEAENASVSAMLSYLSGRMDQALQCYEQALAINPHWPKEWFGRGLVLHRLDRLEEAVASYDRALRLSFDSLFTWQVWHNRGITLSQLSRFDEAIDSFDRSLGVNPNGDDDGLTRLMKFITLVKQGKENLARQDWQEILVAVKQSEKDWWPASMKGKWVETISGALLVVAQSGRLEFVRQLLQESELEEPLFPLARAIDYLQTGNEALIEKLSPEVRGIVEEVVAKLRPGQRN